MKKLIGIFCLCLMIGICGCSSEKEEQPEKEETVAQQEKKEETEVKEEPEKQEEGKVVQGKEVEEHLVTVGAENYSADEAEISLMRKNYQMFAALGEEEAL